MVITDVFLFYYVNFSALKNENGNLTKQLGEVKCKACIENMRNQGEKIFTLVAQCHLA